MITECYEPPLLKGKYFTDKYIFRDGIILPTRNIETGSRKNICVLPPGKEGIKKTEDSKGT